MHLDDKFIELLPDDPREAIIHICDEYRDYFNRIPELDRRYQFTLESYAFLRSFLQAKGFGDVVLDITGKEEHDLKIIQGFIGDLHNKTQAKIHQSTLEDYMKIYTTKFGKVFHYEFSEGDLNKIQELLNKLRNLISETQDLEENHRKRLLKKLEKLQSELNKKVSDLDRFWGFFIDASIVVGIMGENAKPMVDIIKQIVSIIWPTQTRAYELSSDLPFKLLGQPEENKSKDDKS